MLQLRRVLFALVLGLVSPMLVLGTSAVARADDFASGSLIVPMDTTYQDLGMLQAFGLLYQLLQAGVPVQWCIEPMKAHGDVDFTTSAVDHRTRAPVAMHGYRGGPFVIRAADAAAALPIIDAWQATHLTTAVHEATEGFTAHVSRRLVAAPNIAIFADGNEDIARGYLQAAGIPDSTGSTAWAATSPDLLTVAEVSGPTTTDHADGALFDAEGHPAYCQIMSMHWGVGDALRNPEVVAEVRSFLGNPVHFFAECQAVNAFENEPTYGHFLTPYGFLIDNFDGPVDYLHQDEPFAQLDGDFELVGGSERAYTVCRDAPPARCVAGGSYLAADIVMLTRAGTPEGVQDVWMTGYIDGACPPQDETCGTRGKVSYLGGHEYTTRLPISANPTTQGTRLFLQSLFEAPCTVAGGAARMTLTKTAAESTTAAEVTYTLTYRNAGMGVAYAAMIRDTLPTGASFVSATDGGTEAGGVVTWSLGNVGRGETGTVSVTVRFDAFGTFENVARLDFLSGTSPRSVESNRTSTAYDLDTDGDGVVDRIDTCPDDPNPMQDLSSDPDHCGACDNVCAPANATGVCAGGMCGIGSCAPGFRDADRDPTNGCEATAGGVDAGALDGGAGEDAAVSRTDGGASGLDAGSSGAGDAGGSGGSTGGGCRCRAGGGGRARLAWLVALLGVALFASRRRPRALRG